MSFIRMGAVGLAISVIVTAALLPAEAGQANQWEIPPDQVDHRAGKMLDEFEKKLMELPDDGQFGMSRLRTLVVPSHLGTKMEISYGSGYSLFENYAMSAYTLGVFNAKGEATRVRKGTYSDAGKLTKSDLARDEFWKAVESKLKKDATSLAASNKQTIKSSSSVSGQPIILYSRAILPKKECLSCHTEAKMGKTMGVAALVLERREKKEPTRRP
jgi:hypothetical protein